MENNLEQNKNFIERKENIDYKINEINDNNIDSLKELVEESIKENINFVKRTFEEWKNGENNFSKKGEKFWGLFLEDKCIAMGGLNIDPYIENNDGSIGRVRHVYVAQKYRSLGLSKVVMKLIMDEAKKNFKILRLSTKNPIAASLYESLGFQKENNIDENRAEYVYEIMN